MSKLTSTHKTIVAIAAAGALFIAEAAFAGGPPPPVGGTCDPGVVRTSGNALVWALDTDGNTTSDLLFAFGAQATDSPVVGDWDNNDTSNAGITRVFGSQLLWKFDTNGGGTAETTSAYGASTDNPVPGVFGAGETTVRAITRAGGTNQPNSIVWKIDGANDGGIAESTIVFGRTGDTPVVGDWDGDGTDNVGVIRVVNGRNRFLGDTDGGGSAEVIVDFGTDGTDTPLVCNWDMDDIDDATAVRAGSNALFWAQDTGNNGGTAETNTSFGRNAGDTPVAGDWDGL